MNASFVGNHVCDRCWIMASCTNIGLVVSKHDDPVLGTLAVDRQQASIANESERALTYRRQCKVTNTQNTKSDSVKLLSLTVLTPTIQSFPETSSHAKFFILKHPTHLSPLLPT